MKKILIGTFLLLSFLICACVSVHSESSVVSENVSQIDSQGEDSFSSDAVSSHSSVATVSTDNYITDFTNYTVLNTLKNGNKLIENINLSKTGLIGSDNKIIVDFKWDSIDSSDNLDFLLCSNKKTLYSQYELMDFSGNIIETEIVINHYSQVGKNRIIVETYNFETGSVHNDLTYDPETKK